ncbi:NUDIX domain-containing protein [Polycladidibacter stylochi]|uniref:NUDIX domain-containing protein n=1 Tax=Polycladidibacter stylochi TaxID=1807766 RepID=UPI00082B73CE|nr:NUDIX domain-containing protein [Pseudovibrio stylochi]
MKIIHKSYTYLTYGDKLLIFTEPEKPEYGAQTPGGTVDAHESHLIAAHREFIEETGRPLLGAVMPLMDQKINYYDNREPEVHYRRFFYSVLKPCHLEVWQEFQEFNWYETTPNQGGGPILFRFEWISLLDRKIAKPGFFYEGFGEPIERLKEICQLS